MLCNFYCKKTKHIALLFAVLWSCAATNAHATPWRQVLPEAKIVGQGDLRWFGLKIYSARLWSEGETFKPQHPFALELTYHRRITREQFVATSVKEIKRLLGNQYPTETLTLWQQEMEQAFTDVDKGDQLIGLSLPNYGCKFYSQNHLLADIPDPEFARAFFSIWFDPRSKDKGLRAKLLGNRQ